MGVVKKGLVYLPTPLGPAANWAKQPQSGTKELSLLIESRCPLSGPRSLSIYSQHSVATVEQTLHQQTTSLRLSQSPTEIGNSPAQRLVGGLVQQPVSRAVSNLVWRIDVARAGDDTKRQSTNGRGAQRASQGERHAASSATGCNGQHQAGCGPSSSSDQPGHHQAKSG